MRREGDYVLYWIQAYRRLSHNHAFDYALACARELGKPVVVHERLRFDYRWASRRLHRFILEGMRDTAAAAEAMGVPYWPFVATPDDPGDDLIGRLSARACVVVTDDFPCFVAPAQTAALRAGTDAALFAVDGNSVVPLSLLGEPVTAAVHLRRRLGRELPEAWRHRAAARPRPPRGSHRLEPPFAVWNTHADIDALLESLPVDPAVKPVGGRAGGRRAGLRQLSRFLENGLTGYAENRSKPAPPEEGHGSGLSPYLHFGFVSIEEVAEAVRRESPGGGGGFFGTGDDAGAFLDEAITWRDVGYHWHRHRAADTASLDASLPRWALETLRRHGADRRAYVYSPEEWEAGATHDPLWNAAQRELAVTGSIHNYLRMLWGKKVLEWSRTPDEAYATLVHLNNKYALDGRDPNSWTGILWCFGLFDRPWPPERPVYGTVRYMSSANTARKFRLGAYLDWVAGLS